MGLGCGETLCWHCNKSVPQRCGGCSWSNKFEPVEGWVARKTKYGSYRVMVCPEFDCDDEDWDWETDDESQYEPVQGFIPYEKPVDLS